MPSLNDYRNSKQLLRNIYLDICEQFDELLLPYALAQTRGEETDARFAALAEHLAQCAECAETYQDLVQLLALEQSDTWEIPNEFPKIPVPEHEVTESSLRDDAEHSLSLNGVKIWLAKRKESIERLLLNLAEAKSLQLAVRSESTSLSNERELLVDLSSIVPDYPVEVRVSITSDKLAPQRCTLHVEVNLPRRWPDFSGTEVILHMPHANSQSMTTGTSGLVVFQDLDQTTLLLSELEIRP